MTTITIYKDSNQEYREFTCYGHADYALAGRFSFTGKRKPDILCASVSVLVINTINALEELAGEKMTVSENQEDGIIICRFEEKLQEKSVFLLDAMVYGLKTLSRDYGKKYLQVKFEEV